MKAVPEQQEAIDLIGRMKADGLISQRRDGSVQLRTYGRAALVALATIAAQPPKEKK